MKTNKPWLRGGLWIVFASLLLLVAAACGGQTRGPGGGGGGGKEGGEISRPIDMVVPFGAGGGADQVSRLAASAMESELGVQIPVINTPGATGSTGMTSMISSRPGEAMALLIQDTLSTVAFGTAAFTLEEIQGVCRLQDMPSALFVQGNGPYQDWEALADAARSRPGELTVATVGQGGVDDVILAALADEVGVEFRAVPFADPSERYAALLWGSVEAMYEQPGDVLSNLESGEFNPVLVFAEEPVEGLQGDPVLSTEVDADLPILNQFRGIVVNANTDAEILNTLSDACAAVPEDPEFQEFQSQNFSVEESYMGAEEFTEYYTAQAERISELQSRYGLK